MIKGIIFVMVDQERYQPEAEYQDLTELGITPRQLWQIIGLNALISTAISLLIILFIGPWVYGQLNQPIVEGNGLAANQLPVAGAEQNDSSASQNPATPTPAPALEPTLHEIRPGDSLSLIAAQYGVPMQDIMAANGISNPDTIQAGQRLLIPIAGFTGTAPTFTPIPLPTDTPIPFDPPTPEGNGSTQPASDVTLRPTNTPTPIPTATAPPAGQVLVEISTVLGYGQFEEEVVTILNGGPGVNLSGWKLKGSRLGDYNFPNLFLWNGGSVRIHTRSGANTPSDLYWGKDQPHWFSGDSVELVSASGEVISRYNIP